MSNTNATAVEPVDYERPEDAPRWFFNAEPIDLEHWLCAITTNPHGSQDNPAYHNGFGNLVCAFHKGEEPTPRRGEMLAASLEMYRLLQAIEKQLPASPLRDQVQSLLERINAAPEVKPPGFGR